MASICVRQPVATHLDVEVFGVADRLFAVRHVSTVKLRTDRYPIISECETSLLRVLIIDRDVVHRLLLQALEGHETPSAEGAGHVVS